MFNNVGGKIKKYAMFVCWFGISLSVVIAVLMFLAGIGSAKTNGDVGALYSVYGFVAMLLGPVCSWISSLFVYGFGQLIENSDKNS